MGLHAGSGPGPKGKGQEGCSGWLPQGHKESLGGHLGLMGAVSGMLWSQEGITLHSITAPL